MKGLYIHIPFCSSKCKYCDFYSFSPKENDMDSYLEAVLSALEKQKENISGTFDTIYFGGGTPSFFGGERISQIIKKAKECFSFCTDTEITVECNPSSADESLMKALSASGVNRISMGVQSAVTKERQLLGRKSNCAQVQNAISLAKKHGIYNISLDLMLGIPEQTMLSLDESLDFIIESGVTHVSAYMLKIEEGTPLYTEQKSLVFPDEDTVCDMYLHTVKRLESAGFMQYEISNFAKEGFKSRHNTKYWLGNEYLGIGPSAHSFINKNRFFYERDINAFIKGCNPVFDSFGADEEEYIMLRLRLTDGLYFKDYFQKFKKEFSKSQIQKCMEFEKRGLIKMSEKGISLTPEGFLVSNYIISELI